jgi:outer membrane protein
MRIARLILPILLVLPLLGSVADAEEIRLTLRQALERALLAAPEIHEGRYGPPIAETFVLEARSEFDHLFTFRTAGGSSVIPSSSAYDGLDEIKEQTFSAGFGVNQKVRTGGVWGLEFQTDDFLTDSRFYTIRPQWRNALTFRVEQPLLRTAGTEYGDAPTRIAEAGQRSAEQSYRGLVNSVLAAVEKSYWTLVFQREDLAVRQQSLELSQELLRISRRRLDAGSGTRIDVVQADAGVAEREKELILANARVKDAQDALRAFLYPFSAEPEREVTLVPVEPVGEAEEGVEGTLPERIQTAFAFRPDLLALQEELEAAGLKVMRSEDDLLPRLDFFGSGALTSLDDNFPNATSDLFDGDFTRWEIGLSLELPLGNMAAEARNRRAMLERSRYIASFETMKNRVVLDVRVALRRVDTARQEIGATRRASAAAKAQFDAEVDRVRAEKSTNYRLLETEQDLSRAKSQELLASIGYRTALVNLEEATGTYLRARGLRLPSALTLHTPEADEPSE